MKEAYKRFLLTTDQLIEKEVEERTEDLYTAAKSLIHNLNRLPQWDKDRLLAEVVKLSTGRPALFHDINGKRRVNSIEFTQRVMFLIDRSREAAQSASQKPRKHPDRGVGRPMRQPTPGRHSGAQRERDAGWS